ncbi:hypothetical protein ACTMTF_07600 [Nonomuraea sp. ZG12]|uniref:hypothetical protein n=1 Tax=Nonomuraea sp. ZG12 TaxID=3452207 RepID=UPI003F8B3763
MNTIRAVLLSMATVGALLIGMPAASADTPDRKTAQEAPVAAYNAEPREAGAAGVVDGRFWIYEHAYEQGRGCGYGGDWNNYQYSGLNCGNMDNIATSVYNRGYVHQYDDVVMWRDPGFVGPWMCLGHGDYWQDFTLGREVFHTGESADNKISSHAWVTTCG